MKYCVFFAKSGLCFNLFVTLHLIIQTYLDPISERFLCWVFYHHQSITNYVLGASLTGLDRRQQLLKLVFIFFASWRHGGRLFTPCFVVQMVQRRRTIGQGWLWGTRAPRKEEENLRITVRHAGEDHRREIIQIRGNESGADAQERIRVHKWRWPEVRRFQSPLLLRLRWRWVPVEKGETQNCVHCPIFSNAARCKRAVAAQNWKLGSCVFWLLECPRTFSKAFFDCWTNFRFWNTDPRVGTGSNPQQSATVFFCSVFRCQKGSYYEASWRQHQDIQASCFLNGRWSNESKTL